LAINAHITTVHRTRKRGPGVVAGESIYSPSADDGSRHHPKLLGKLKERQRVSSGLELALAMSPGARELIMALTRLPSDPKHVCGPECYEEHKSN
jgi:hypothetical protein